MCLAAALVLLALAPIVGAQVALPEIGDPSRRALSSTEEYALGDAFLREIRVHLTLLDDLEIESYVGAMGDALVAAGESQEQRFRFYVVDSPRINAFAGPGGIIAVNTGLIALTRNESELASVVAHEIAHVTQRHLARAFEVAERTNPLAIAGLLAALVLASQNPEMGQAAVASVLAGSIQKGLDFTRQNEQEADRVGTALLARAGYDPRAMPTFFERLQQSNRYYAQPPEFLSTHPVTITRIAESRARAEQYPYKQHADSVDYLLVKAKVQALAIPKPAEAIAQFEAQMKEGLFRSEDAVRYGLAVALMRAQRWGEARPHVEWLLERHPQRVAMLAAMADIERRTGAQAKARSIYRDTLSVFTHDALMTREYAEMLLDEGEVEQALTLLQDYAKVRTPDATVFGLLARAYDGAGRRLEANAALAEQHFARGDVSAAINQLDIALRAPGGSDYAAARTQARLEELQHVQRLRGELRRP